MRNAPRISKPLILVAAAALVPLLATGADEADVTGTWTMNVETGMGSGSPTLTLTQDGDTITGTYKGFFGEAPVTGTISGDEVALSIEVSAQGQDLKVDYVGTVDRDTMSGKVVFGEYGEGTFEGTRKQPDEE
ncbi:MAG: hypothetical protein PVJ73_12040 [Acidobacteriota bacterium]|jgi:hypothetical protein